MRKLDKPQAHETPRHFMVSIRISPMVELARWLFELEGIPYADSTHAPLFHVIFTYLAGGGKEVPVVRAPEAVWDGGRNVALRLADRAPASQLILSQDDAARDEEITFIDKLFDNLLRQVRRKVYFHMLPHKDLLTPMVTYGAPAWESWLVQHCYPLWRWRMEKALETRKKDQALIDAAPLDIAKAFDLVEQRLAGRRFLGGDEPCGLDIIFAALAGGVIFPDGYGGVFEGKPITPPPDALPEELRAYVKEMRARRAGQLVLDVYATARPREQRTPFVQKPTKDRFPYKSAIWVLKLFQSIRPRFEFGNRLCLLRWADVRMALDNDVSFKIGAINGKRVHEACGDFILGMDRSARLLDERIPLYEALHTLKLDEIRGFVREESRRLVERAARNYRRTSTSDGVTETRQAVGGRLEVVNGYARLIAARTAVKMFGVSGPSEPDLLRVSRAIFHHTFLNLDEDSLTRETCIAAGKELKIWIEDEIRRRRDKGAHVDDVLQALLATAKVRGFDDDFVARSLSGLIVGAIDTTTTAVTNIIIELMSDEAVARQVSAQIDDDERLTRWCWELLRRRPHNLVLLRTVEEDIDIDDLKASKGKQVFAVTLAAMHDPSAFPNPGKLDPTRPQDRYLHFGAGIHRCAGRAINTVQIPEIVRELLRAGPYRMEPLRVLGPFPDQLIVDIPARDH